MKEKLFKVVIGTGKNGRNSIEDIWVKEKENKWICKSKSFSLEDWQITHDIECGYLKIIT